jgi:hypothetical protein
MDRLGMMKRDTAAIAFKGGTPQTRSVVQESALRTPSLVGDQAESRAAVREGGSLYNFPGKAGIPLQ